MLLDGDYDFELGGIRGSQSHLSEGVHELATTSMRYCIVVHGDHGLCARIYMRMGVRLGANGRANTRMFGYSTTTAAHTTYVFIVFPAITNSPYII